MDLVANCLLRALLLAKGGHSIYAQKHMDLCFHCWYFGPQYCSS